jgi:two-component system, chemotaxis family, sensor kinase Cph1
MSKSVSHPVYDLSNCASEPIHIPGSIQPHGVLLGLEEPSLLIRVASTSAVPTLTASLDELINVPIERFLDERSMGTLRAALTLFDPFARGPFRIQLHGPNPIEFDATVHRSEGLVLFELEPLTSTRQQAVELPQFLTRAMAELRAAQSIVSVAQVAANRIRELSGYDRCMVYRFDSRQNGEVVGESKLSSLESYLGLHYPEADIPPQARRLYKENTIRLIVDVGYEPSLLEPSVNPYSGTPINLGRAQLRSVSQLHRDYLTNMGVRGTLAVSLLVRGELWGLVVCHHYSPRHISAELRATCEALGLFLSQRIADLEQRLSMDRLSSLRQLASRLNALPELNVENPSYKTAFESLCRLLECSALAWWPAGSEKPFMVGLDDVSTESISELRGKLDALDDTSGVTFETDRVTDVVGEDSPLTAHFCGLIASRLTSRESWLFGMRPEHVREVHWGSAKEKKVTMVGNTPRLSPEGSFGLWKETVHRRSRPWTETDRHLFAELSDILKAREATQLVEYSVRIRELKRVADAKDEFLAQLSHELRNPLNAILGWADLLSNDASTLPPQAQRGIEVIERNARLQARLIDDLLDVSRIVKGSLRLELNPHSVEPILRAVLESVQGAVTAKSLALRTIVDPGIAPINADADRLQQVIWNLLSNAVKFTPKGGGITVTLRESHSSILLEVDNTGSQIEPELLPHIFDRFRQGAAGATSRMGLGLGLAIAKGLVELHGGKIFAENTPVGVRFSIFLPVLAYQPAAASRPPEPQMVTFAPDLLRGVKILLVDDEAEAIEVLNEVLSRAGAAVEMYSCPLTLLSESSLDADILISDLGMPSLMGTELVRQLRGRGFTAPALALSAYTTRNHQLAALRAGFNLHVPKPVDREQLLISVGSLLGRFHEE